MKIEYAVTRLATLPGKKSLVSVSITPEVRFNGFSGATLEFSVDDATMQTEIADMVKRKVAQEVGRSEVEIVERSGQ